MPRLTFFFDVWLAANRKRIRFRLCPYCYEKMQELIDGDAERHDEPTWIPNSERDPKDYRHEEILDVYKN